MKDVYRVGEPIQFHEDRFGERQEFGPFTVARDLFMDHEADHFRMTGGNFEEPDGVEKFVEYLEREGFIR